MGFLVFTILLLPAILLYAAVQTVLSPFAGVLAPVLALLNDPVFVYWMLRVLLVWNILVLAALVLVRRSIKRARGPGWKRGTSTRFWAGGGWYGGWSVWYCRWACGGRSRWSSFLLF